MRVEVIVGCVGGGGGCGVCVVVIRVHMAELLAKHFTATKKWQTRMLQVNLVMRTLNNVCTVRVAAKSHYGAQNSFSDDWPTM